MERLCEGHWHFLKTLSIAATCLCFFNATPAVAQDNVAEQKYRTWAKRSLKPIASTELGAPKSDLRALRPMVGDAKIVALSELEHGGAEVLAFRNRLFKYLVEDLGFDAIVVESGVVEGRVVNDYVLDGKGELDSVMKQGFSWTIDLFRQNRELVAWIKEHNDRLPRGARKVKFYGLDVPGSPGNTVARRGLNTSIVAALEYLQTVDPTSAGHLQDRIGKFLPRLTRSGYGLISQSERDELTAAIGDLISLIEHRRFQYIKKSSPSDYEWSHRAAIGARQVDVWLRTMPLDWKDKDGHQWMANATQTRERSMADNLEWVADQLEPGSRMLVFAAVNHMITTAKQFNSTPDLDLYPFGIYAKERFGKDFVTILGWYGGGQIANCFNSKHPRIDLKHLPGDAAEPLFGSLDSAHYVLDLRTAPSRVTEWLRQSRNHSGIWFPTARAFDMVHYVKTLSPACYEP
jgi:erythromycin esterase